ncbi:MAG: branched-chain amino acid ABC transporter permease [Deltaproteobacteria bacterium]|jgi:branched-chain amino acid transport system permease protein|nr:branched-chain amino acid ABC transporter permease [Deltaproteobacteria bacterium]
MTPKTRDRWLTYLSVLVLLGILLLAQEYADEYQVRILNMVAIYITLAVSYNLINGVTGQFSLEPNAFVALGAYTASLLTLTPLEKEMSFIIDPCIWPLSVISIPFLPAVIIGGLVAAFFGFLMGFPVFRVRGDYLAIVTLGFGEVIRVVANNLQSVTNGPLGLKGIALYTNLWWSWGLALVTLFVINRLVKSSYGRALKAIRENELAAESMGINAFRHKLLAFTMSAFFEGMAGALLAHLITTISPMLFTFFMTFNLLIIITIGGLGSITGSVLAAIAFAWGSELLRAVEEPINILGLYTIPGIPGMRMVIFSIILIVVMIFARKGFMGRREFTWQWLFDRMHRKEVGL